MVHPYHYLVKQVKFTEQQSVLQSYHFHGRSHLLILGLKMALVPALSNDDFLCGMILIIGIVDGHENSSIIILVAYKGLVTIFIIVRFSETSLSVTRTEQLRNEVTTKDTASNG